MHVTELNVEVIQPRLNVVMPTPAAPFIYVWSDGTYCDPEDESLDDYAHMSDDFAKVLLKDDESAEDAAQRHIKAEAAYWASL